MKTIITTLNSKFIHSSLSVRYLKSICRDIPNIEVYEFTINQNKDYIAGEIYKTKPDIVAFSCYIWNLEETLNICEVLKIVNPSIKIVLGGPEVSFDGENILKKYSFIDFIIYGEGELTFRELIIRLIDKKEKYIDIKGLIYREKEKVIINEPRPLIKNLDTIPSPYEELSGLKNKIVYYESSRGCPFNCQFCLSSTIKGVRFFSLDRVKEDLGKLIDAKVRQVKFVDRTFNTKKEYAMEIMKFIMDKDPKNMNFHFEVTAHLLDKEMLDFLSKAKEGLFQFEIGIQSTNPETIKAIGRTTDIEKAKEVTKIIKSYKNIHQHLDLIAGLPYEDYNTFRNSFNEIYELRPEKLQLGFLKLLKGSGLRKNKEKYGFKFLDRPPYEVLATEYISYDEMLKLKTIEDLLEKYGNESSFENSLQYIIKNYYDSPFCFYEKFACYWEEKEYHKLSHSKKKLYKILYEFYKDVVKKNLNIFNEILKFDYITNNVDFNIPNYINRVDVDKLRSERHDFLQNYENLLEYLPSYKNISPRKIINEVHFETFNFNIIDFIDNNYRVKELRKMKTTLLFIYKNNKALNKCEVRDVTDKFNS